jgi:predicted transposase YbfD/YdcC
MYRSLPRSAALATKPRPLADYFADLRDPRVALKCDHEFLDILLIVVVATIGGADDFVSAAAFARAKEDWFRERLGLQLPNGVPSHDTLNRVFAIIAPEPFQECFLGFVASMSECLRLKQIPIDGKALRGSKRKTLAGHRTAHIVSAWASENGVTLAQVRTDEKSNEITAIPELLALLDVSGALVSIDAIGCQKGIAAQIVDQKGDYLLAVKGNQPRLFEDLQRLADAALERGYEGLSTNLQEGTAHGRQEMRFCFVIADLESVRDRALWPRLRSMVGIVSSRVVGGKASDEVRYYISSRKASAKVFQRGVRTHWSIENSCHWVLDVAFREDDHRLREGHAPENMSLVRKMALAMLKKANANMGIKNKRLRAGWDEAFLEHTLRDFLDK